MLLDRLEITYERPCIATKSKVYFTKMLDSLLKDNECSGTPFLRGKLQEAFIIVMEDNVNSISMDNFFRSPVTINAQKKDANVTNERQISADIHAKNDKIIQGVYNPINNKQFCTLQFRGTSWCHKQFQGSGWKCKQFQGTGWRRKWSKKRSKQRSKGIYLHYQRKLSTKNIQEPVRP